LKGSETMDIETSALRPIGGPSPLTEVGAARRPSRAEPRRRWFHSDTADLYVWIDESDRPFSFQLSYEKRTHEFALTWSVEHGFNHSKIDSSKGAGQQTASPLVSESTEPDLLFLRAVFAGADGHLPKDISALVTDALRLYPESPNAPGRRPVLYKGVFSRLGPFLTWQTLFWALVLLVTLASLRKVF
jgi:hypothetical protein